MKVRFKVANLDGVPDRDGDILTADNVVLESNELPVLLNFTDHVCTASVTVEGDAIYAKADIGDVDGYPAVGMWNQDSGPPFFTVDRIGISSVSNSDPRIEPIGEQRDE